MKLKKENLILIKGEFLDLKSIIAILINSNKEDVFYDFKEQFTEKSDDLVKDIISLANCKHDGDRYLIIGVSENNNEFNVVGVPKENRRTQAMVQDILDNMRWGGDNIPQIKLETLNLEDFEGNLKEVDVIIIKNTNSKPYYLLNKNRYVIWTRHNDKNSEATYDEIKEMWKEHLGLTTNVKENFKTFLQDYDNWEYNRDDKLIYYIPNPDYYIKFGEIDHTPNMREPFSKFYLNDTFNYCKASFKVRDTTIFSCEYIFCDGFCTEFPIPNFEVVNKNDYLEGFYYYLYDDLQGSFAGLMFTMTRGMVSRFHKFPCLFFNNPDDLNNYLKFLKNFNETIELPDDYYPVGAYKDDEYFNNVDLNSLRRNKWIYDIYLNK